MTAFYITISILAVIMLILLIPIDVILDFSYNKNENRGAIIVRYMMFKFKIFPSKDKIEEEVVKDIDKVEEKVDSKNDFKRIVKFVKAVYAELKDDILKVLDYLFNHVICIKELNISAKYGTGDPMYTGIVTGVVNATVYNFISFLDRKIWLDKWNVSLDADFNNACISAGVYCKIRTRGIYVITLGFKVLWLMLKIQKINRRIK